MFLRPRLEIRVYLTQFHCMVKEVAKHEALISPLIRAFARSFFLRFLMEELDKRGDNYRSLPLTIAIEEEDKSFALPQVDEMFVKDNLTSAN